MSRLKQHYDEVVRPALTTVHVPHGDMGREAAQELVNMVEHRSSGRSVTLETSIRIRASLGPGPASRSN